jgi:hypothetical protein
MIIGAAGAAIGVGFARWGGATKGPFGQGVLAVMSGGTVGGLSNVAMGGDFWRGFTMGAVSAGLSFAGNMVANNIHAHTRTAGRAPRGEGLTIDLNKKLPDSLEIPVKEMNGAFPGSDAIKTKFEALWTKHLANNKGNGEVSNSPTLDARGQYIDHYELNSVADIGEVRVQWETASFTSHTHPQYYWGHLSLRGEFVPTGEGPSVTDNIGAMAGFKKGVTDHYILQVDAGQRYVYVFDYNYTADPGYHTIQVRWLRYTF